MTNVKCRFFVIGGDGPTLLGILEIELFGIIRVICDTIENKTTGMKFDSQTKHVADSPNCKTNKDPQAKPDESSRSKDKIKLSDYLNSSKRKLICQIISIPVTTKKQTKEQVRQSQVEYTINLMFFSLA